MSLNALARYCALLVTSALAACSSLQDTLAPAFQEPVVVPLTFTTTTPAGGAISFKAVLRNYGANDAGQPLNVTMTVARAERGGARTNTIPFTDPLEGYHNYLSPPRVAPAIGGKEKESGIVIADYPFSPTDTYYVTITVDGGGTFNLPTTMPFYWHGVLGQTPQLMLFIDNAAVLRFSETDPPGGPCSFGFNNGGAPVPADACRETVTSGLFSSTVLQQFRHVPMALSQAQCPDGSGKPCELTGWRMCRSVMSIPVNGADLPCPFAVSGPLGCEACAFLRPTTPVP